MAAYDRREFKGGAIKTALTGNITSGDVTIPIADSTGWPDGAGGHFFIVINRGGTSEEKINCQSRSALNITVPASAGRGQDGTSAAAHVAGETVEHVHVAQDDDEANYTVSQTIGKATGQGQVLVSSGVNSFAAVDVKGTGKILVGNGTTAVDVSMSGDATLASTGVLTIGSGAVTSSKIADGTIVDADVNAAAAIATTKLSPNPLARANHTGTQLMATISDAGTLATKSTVASSDITNGTIATVDLADGSITTAKIVDANVTGAKLASGAVQAAQLGTNPLSTYTPTWTQGATITHSTQYGNYVQLGSIVYLWAMCTASSSGTTGSAMNFTLPVAQAIGGTDPIVIGTCRFSNGSNVTLPGVVIITSSSTVVTCDFGTGPSAVPGGVDAATFQIVSGSSISFHIVYPA